jgi:hypothetical protein
MTFADLTRRYRVLQNMHAASFQSLEDLRLKDVRLLGNQPYCWTARLLFEAKVCLYARPCRQNNFVYFSYSFYELLLFFLCNFICCFVWIWNLVSYSKERIQFKYLKINCCEEYTEQMGVMVTLQNCISRDNCFKSRARFMVFCSLSYTAFSCKFAVWIRNK